MQPHTVIIGAGPAGLTAAYLLTKRGLKATVVEADPEHVGGIARTVCYKGFYFDIGGHRFFSKSKQVEDLWTELLPNDMLVRPRSSRIYYRGRFFSYPLKPMEALWKLGFIESFLCVLSYCKARLFPAKNVRSFEDWVSNQFGARLFSIFFKTYTEKVWGMTCQEISADWAAQRNKNLSLGSAVLNAVLPRRQAKGGDQLIKTLIGSFRYPRKGPGMLWQACADKVKSQGGEFLMGHKVDSLVWDSGGGRWKIGYSPIRGGEQTFVEADHVISSAPIRELARSIQPALSQRALDAAARLRYRDFLTVIVMLKDKNVLADNWIYVHDPSVKVGRIQNFKSWSPEMVPDPSMACYGLEYFCFEGDGLWSSPDAQLLDLARRELEQIGLAKTEDIIDGCVVRQVKAYPVYDDDYLANVQIVREEIERSHPTLHLVGRNGMHKYNNQDHAMMTAMLTVENIVAGKTVYDVWCVNQDAEYHEVGADIKASAASGLRAVPQRVKS